MRGCEGVGVGLALDLRMLGGEELGGPGMLCAGGHQVAPATPEPAREGPRSPPGSGVQPAHLLQAFHAAATGRPLPRRPVRTRRGRTSGSAWLLQ